jgi:beta-galactosidase/beta-glucuronidase
MKAISVMGETIDKMSTELTDKAIESSRRSEEMTAKPVLSTAVFVANVEKLRAHFETIDTYRAQVAVEAAAQRQVFADASRTLADIHVLGKGEQEELVSEMNTVDTVDANVGTAK